LGPASGGTTTIIGLGTETVVGAIGLGTETAGGAGCGGINKDFQKALVLLDLLSKRDLNETKMLVSLIITGAQ
jgi:hypothetical protein